MRMELFAYLVNDLLHWTAADLAFLYLARSPVDNRLPLRFGVRVDRRVETGNQLAGKESPVLHWQSQHFGHFL
jgi:hypothetical protein